jgi:hypothetical protein
MSLFLAVGQQYVPSFIKKRTLQELFEVTAGAFQCRAPDPKGFSYEEYLNEYAQFTRDKADEGIKRGIEAGVKQRLYDGAYTLAQKTKHDYHINSTKDALKMARIVYGILKIDFQSDPQGEVTIKRCFFSGIYAKEVCRLISSLDEGFLEGLTGGRFRFSQRMTEGKDRCLARFTFDRSLG